MGIVYRARDRTSGEIVALKILRARAGPHVERFAREAHALSDVRHPAIARYVAHGQTPSGEHYLAMEWLDGRTLGELLRERRLSVLETLRVGARIADALAAAHARSVVHRDL